MRGPVGLCLSRRTDRLGLARNTGRRNLFTLPVKASIDQETPNKVFRMSASSGRFEAPESDRMKQIAGKVHHSASSAST
jgi:hypothetical protein